VLDSVLWVACTHCTGWYAWLTMFQVNVPDAVVATSVCKMATPPCTSACVYPSYPHDGSPFKVMRLTHTVEGIVSPPTKFQLTFTASRLRLTPLSRHGVAAAIAMAAVVVVAAAVAGGGEGELAKKAITCAEPSVTQQTDKQSMC
jgi:hypothetical protein